MKNQLPKAELTPEEAAKVKELLRNSSSTSTAKESIEILGKVIKFGVFSVDASIKKQNGEQSSS